MMMMMMMMTMKIKGYIFWDITPCSPFKVSRRFGGTCPLSWLSPDNTALYLHNHRCEHLKFCSHDTRNLERWYGDLHRLNVHIDEYRSQGPHEPPTRSSQILCTVLQRQSCWTVTTPEGRVGCPSAGFSWHSVVEGWQQTTQVAWRGSTNHSHLVEPQIYTVLPLHFSNIRLHDWDDSQPSYINRYGSLALWGVTLVTLTTSRLYWHLFDVVYMHGGINAANN
jgi:hypothetical protein